METQHRNSPQAVELSLRIGRRLWRLFSSLQLAVVLMLVLVGLGLLGTLLVQVPSGVVSDSGKYAQRLVLHYQSSQAGL